MYQNNNNTYRNDNIDYQLCNTKGDNKIVIDLENTEIHSSCELSQSAEKLQTIFTDDALEIRN